MVRRSTGRHRGQHACRCVSTVTASPAVVVLVAAWLLCGAASTDARAQGSAAPREQSPGPSADFRHVDANRRVAAAVAAGARRDRAAVDALVDLLRDRVAVVRLAAVRALHLIGGPGTSRHLMVVAQTDIDARVREAAQIAVRGIDPAGYVSKLATADKHPVLRVRRVPAGALRRQTRSVFFAPGLALDALRAKDTLGGLFGAGLRWPRGEGQLSLLFPAMGLSGQVRLNLLVSGRVIPYLSGGFALVFGRSEDQPNGPVAALFVGAGLRVRATSRWFVYAEALVSFVVSQVARPVNAGVSDELRTVSLPVIAGLGLELWP